MAVETLRRNGEYMITRTVKIHLDLMKMRDALLWRYRYKMEDLPALLRSGKRRIEDEVISTLMLDGVEQIGYWGDEYSLDEIDQITAQVENALHRYWPKL